jgi:type IV pilus assembly protein PilE
MKRLLNKKLPAFTLMELLMVLGAIAVLTLLVVTNYSPVISKAKSVEAQQQLEFIHTLEKTYFYIHSKYSTSFSEIGYEHAKLVTDGGNGNYKIEITDAGTTGFKARATAVVDFDADGNFNVWEVDQDKKLNEVTPD